MKEFYTPEEITPKLTNVEQFRLDSAIANLSSKDLKYIALVRKENNIFAIYVYATIANSAVKHKRQIELALAIKGNTFYLSSMFYFTYLAGYRYYFKGMKTTCYCPIDKDSENVFERVEGLNINVGISEYLGLDRYALKTACLNDETYKYFDWSFIENIGTLQDLIKVFKNISNYPHDCEILIKRGYSDYIKYEQIFTGNKAEWVNKIKLFKKYHIDNFNYSLLQFSMKYNKNGDCKEKLSTLFVRNFMRVMKRIKQNDSFGRYLFRYLLEQKVEPSEYLDFIKNRESIGLSNADKSALTPRDLHEAMKAVAEKLSKKENKELDLKIKDTLVKLDITNKEYQIVQPKTTYDLVDLGNRYHNCIGWNHYDRRIAKKECLIFEIRKENEDYACVEIDKDGIVQLRGYDNQSCDESARTFVNRYLLPQLSNYGWCLNEQM